MIAKRTARAKTLATLPLGMEEKAYLLSSWVAPVVYLNAQAYEPTRKVLAHLNLVQHVALNFNSWHLTMGILSMPKRKGGLALWVHSYSFVTLVFRPQAYPESQVTVFRSWAQRVGLVLEESALPYIQLAIKHPSFLQGALRSYSQLRRGGGSPPPPRRFCRTWVSGTLYCSAETRVNPSRA